MAARDEACVLEEEEEVPWQKNLKIWNLPREAAQVQKNPYMYIDRRSQEELMYKQILPVSILIFFANLCLRLFGSLSNSGDSPWSSSSSVFSVYRQEEGTESQGRWSQKGWWQNPHIQYCVCVCMYVHMLMQTPNAQWMQIIPILPWFFFSISSLPLPSSRPSLEEWLFCRGERAWLPASSLPWASLLSLWQACLCPPSSRPASPFLLGSVAEEKWPKN